VLAPPASDAPPPRGIRVAYSDTAAAVYELPGAWPRAGLLEVPGLGRRLITTLCDDGGRRVLAAGRPVPSGRDDGGFLAARLPPDGEVHLLYRPRGLLAGCALGAVAASLMLLALLAPPRSGRGRRSR
jgi:hypothetical protein